MNISLDSEHHQNFLKLHCANNKLALQSAFKNIRRTGIAMITLLVATSAQVLFAWPVGSQPINKVEITLNLNNETLIQAFGKIETLSPFRFMYHKEEVDNTGNLNLPASKKTVEEFLKIILANTSLTYKQVNDQILIMPAKKPVKESAADGDQFSRTLRSNIVRGRVTDAKGVALAGVTITVKGTSVGTSSDVAGNFLIEAPENGTLVFSDVNFETREVPVSKRHEINVAMEVKISALDQVVVVGYGTQKKSSVTAAISTMKGKEVAAVPVTNLSNLLGGRMSGVIFRQGSGEPGLDASSIYIRGISTTGNTQPLLIVDDIPRSFQDLDANTIESFTVLKDAAAVAPYGVAGANGVILVTTKRGKAGTPSLTYNGFVGFQNPTVLAQYPSSYEYGLLSNAASKNEGLPPMYSAAVLQKYKDGSEPDKYPNANPWDLINRNSILTNHNIEVSGGAERIKYYGSIGYQHEAGLFAATSQNRYNLTLNVDAQVTNSTKVSIGINGRQQDNNYPSATTARIFQQIANVKPTVVQAYSNGMDGNLLAGLIHSDGYRKTNTFQVYSQLSIEQEFKFIPGLKLKGSMAFDPTNTLNKNWLTPIKHYTLDTITNIYNLGLDERTKSELGQTLTNATQITYQASLNYSRTIKKNNFSLLALFESKANNSMSFSAARVNYALSIDELNMGSSSQADISNSGSSTKARQEGLVYRVQYDYDSKYLFEASGRYDGSYYFAPNKQFGFFPAFSAGWRLSNENFIKQNFKWIDNLKLRASYGEVGALAGSAFQYLSTYGVYGPSYVVAGSAVQGINERLQANPSITWERAKKTDLGFEASFWNGLINIEADYFYEKRSNMLTTPDAIIPSEYGIGVSQVNAGVMKNQGIDFSIGSIYNVSKDLQVSLTGNFTYAKNSLLQVFENASTFKNPNRRLTGRPLGTQFGYKAIGYFQQNDFDAAGALKPGIVIPPWGAVKPGDIRYQDTNGDGKLTTDDQVQTGYAQTPQIIYGISPKVRYKGFSLDLLFQGAARTSFYGTEYYAWAWSGGVTPVRQNLDYWTPDNTNAKNPRITSSPTVNNTQVSSFWMNNSSYLRFKSAILSYTIPAGLIQKIRIQNARFFVSGENLATWTKIINYDPEILDSKGTNYSLQKVVALGLNVTF